MLVDVSMDLAYKIKGSEVQPSKANAYVLFVCFCLFVDETFRTMNRGQGCPNDPK